MVDGRRSPLLVIKGPTGSGKTTTLAALASDLGVTIREWINPVHYADARVSPYHDLASFLFKDAKYAPPTELLLLKDLPIFTKSTLATFHARLAHLLKSPAHRRPARLVLIVTEFNLPHDLTRRGSEYYDVPDLRDLVPDSLTPWVDVISFNPVAPTLVTKALRRVCDTHRLPTRDIKSVVETANGDLRHALNCLQFIHVLRPSRAEADTLAEQHHKEFSKSLFSSLGRVLYDKRDLLPHAVTPSSTPPASTVTLPPHLAHWARAPLEVDCAVVLDHLTVAPETYALFVHANVDQFITGLGARVWVADVFAATDVMGTMPVRELVRMYAVTLAHGVHDQVLDMSWADLVDDDADDCDWTRDEDAAGAGTPPSSLAPSTVLVEPTAPASSSSQSSSSAKRRLWERASTAEWC
ncbi:hypothetical protein AMAG_03076 [Allomyces macrogynus ATCC 38327]|uniref:AAA+ ATPase domain-containing protein n=1 Tax=Allomyces macrogynus (strain ATCC 38327) TaxID=578462 RepID=A0A0L0S4B1_ALLM3|nr:hypothetical protein AMAG_03076 [Allomyces macrogynus ATCC 38327]|eukprot:KNE57357.1 hypothetical protein AMAG_03076 [Allomyces macrogynus ATCC 38327]